MEHYERNPDDMIFEANSPLIFVGQKKAEYQPEQKIFKMLDIPRCLEEPIRMDLVNKGLNLDDYKITVEVKITATKL
jgi:hypothetical protein